MEKKSRQATASSKGYILQGYFGIFFFFENKNYKNIDWIKIESLKEDIEITYYDNSKDFIQVKTHEFPAKNLTFDTEKFKKGIKTLYEAYQNTPETKVNRLILANNMFKQGIPRQDKKILLGDEENFLYKIIDHFTSDEIKEFSAKIDNEVKDILFLARVDETFLLKNGNRILPDLKKIINLLELENIQENIQESLKVLFNENSSERILTINKKQVAWCFIKHKVTATNVYNKFNKDFKEEIDDLGIIEIEFLIENSEIYDMIKNYSADYQIYMFFQRKIEEYYIKVGRITSDNLKKIMMEIANEMLKNESLFIKDNYSKEEKELIYYFFTYFLYFNRNIKKIYDEFNIKEI